MTIISSSILNLSWPEEVTLRNVKPLITEVFELADDSDDQAVVNLFNRFLKVLEDRKSENHLIFKIRQYFSCYIEKDKAPPQVGEWWDSLDQLEETEIVLKAAGLLDQKNPENRLNMIETLMGLVEICSNEEDLLLILKQFSSVGANLKNMKLCEVSPLKGLIFLNFSGCSEVDDPFLETLSSKFGRLKFLNISNCPNVTNIGLKYLGSLDGLEMLNIALCPSISSSGIWYLWNIQSIVVSSFHGEGNGFSWISKLPNLKELRIANKFGMTIREVNAMKKIVGIRARTPLSLPPFSESLPKTRARTNTL